MYVCDFVINLPLQLKLSFQLSDFYFLFLGSSLTIGIVCFQEWQARQREKTKELRRLQKAEEEEEEGKMEEYREIGLRMKGFPQEDVRKARKLVSSFIRAEEEVEEVIS